MRDGGACVDFAHSSTQTFICFRQQVSKAQCPFMMSDLIVDEIVADLNQGVIQAASFSMHRNSVIGGVIHDVGRVIADEKLVIRAKQHQQLTRQASIAIVEHASMPEPTCAFKRGGEAVQGNEHGGPVRALTTIELGLNLRMV